jgi:hypothetical protein
MTKQQKLNYELWLITSTINILLAIISFLYCLIVVEQEDIISHSLIKLQAQTV